MDVRNLLCDEDGAVTTDWVVLAAAVVGLGAAVLSTISTGSLDLAGRTSQALLDTSVSMPLSDDNETVLTDDGTNWFPWVARSETDENGNWAYNDENQLINPDDGSLLPIMLTMNIDGSAASYSNQRGELTDENGVILQ